MKLFGLAWTDPRETYDVRWSHQRETGRWYYPKLQPEDLAISLLLMQYNLPPTKPLPWWIVDFSGHMEKFDGFPQTTRLLLPAGDWTEDYVDCLWNAPEILPPEPWNYRRIWTREENRSK